MQILMKVHVINFWLPFILAATVHIFRTHIIFGGQSICPRMNFHNLIIWSSIYGSTINCHFHETICYVYLFFVLCRMSSVR